MDDYKSTDRQFGYNLRRDSSTQMIVHEETKQLIEHLLIYLAEHGLEKTIVYIKEKDYL